MHAETWTIWGYPVACFFLLVAMIAPSHADTKETESISLSLGGGTLPPGGLIALPLSLAAGGSSADTLVVDIGLDAAQLTLSGVESGDGAMEKQLDYQQTEMGVALVFYGGGGPLQAGNLATLYLEAAAETSPASVSLTPGASSASNSEANAISVSLSTATVTIAPLAAPHDADTSANGRMELSELLRVVQLYNAGTIGCDDASEDGFAPGSGDTSCAPHDLDYRTQNWRIDLGELLRCIQFYNSFKGSYHADETGEDGFAPGLAP